MKESVVTELHLAHGIVACVTRCLVLIPGGR